MKSPWKNPLFLIGFIFIASLLIASILYSEITHNHVRQFRILYDNHGKMIEVSPISPKWNIPFGTDRLGFDMFTKVLIGAKYTILGAIAVAAIRMFLAIPIGLFLGTYLRKQKKYFSGLVDSFHFIPLTVLAVYILTPILYEPLEGFHNTMTQRVVIEIILLALLTVPVIAVLISNEASKAYQEEFVTCSKTLGASKLRLIRKHIFPAMREKIFVIFGQQIMQALIIFAHLGLFQLFFGGTHNKSDGLFRDPPVSVSNEWSGLIGDSFRYLNLASWIPLTPIICFAITMLALSFMIEGYVQATTGHSHYFKRKKRNHNVKSLERTPLKIELEKFEKIS
ncbi:ABC transporter permease subunit [Bacillus sp. FJAT-49736]|uniref:ABC transporter permease n=1 Tax=Bacillus sp. FJAT-49736 TaxID=2833582 RepID=UPI001BC954A6|nr:ABC transporter permease subunit [Bacillus sp. FJAT-49736]MBS4175353.1 ABC transporter permease [Bacillus sp. FJAT-49736]